MKRCKLCHSNNIRLSGQHAATRRAHPLQSPYRCQDCDSRFWVLSHPARLTVIAGVCAGIAFALLSTPVVQRPVSPSTPRLEWVGAPGAAGPDPARLSPALYVDVRAPGAPALSPVDFRALTPMQPPVEALPGTERMD